jgi:6-pyruvoyltetrahydropterin/6-carboxytetrahydropterin synthase
MMYVSKEFIFDAAHKLYLSNIGLERNLELFGKCSNLHGHTYKVIVTVESSNWNDQTGMLINFAELKKIVQKAFLEKFDHCYLNDLPEFHEILPTAENLARVMYDLLTMELTDYFEQNDGCESFSFDFRITSIKVYETPTSSAEYTGV